MKTVVELCFVYVHEMNVQWVTFTQSVDDFYKDFRMILNTDFEFVYRFCTMNRIQCVQNNT